MAKTKVAKQGEKEEAKRDGAQTDSKVSAIIAWSSAIVQNGAPKRAKVEREET